MRTDRRKNATDPQHFARRDPCRKRDKKIIARKISENTGFSHRPCYNETINRKGDLFSHEFYHCFTGSEGHFRPLR